MDDLTQEGLAERGLRVKPLEWDDLAHDSFTAATSLGDYIVELHGSWGMWTPDEGEFSSDAHSWHISESAAKSAAQANYAARILAALELDRAALAASPEVAALISEAEARGMERAAEIARKHWYAGGAEPAIRAAAAAIRGEGK